MVLRSRWTLMTVKLEDKDGALKVAHHHLFKRYPLDKLGRKFKSSGRRKALEEEVCLSSSSGEILSATFGRSAVRRRLREKG